MSHLSVTSDRTTFIFIPFVVATTTLFLPRHFCCGTCPLQRNEYSKPNRIMASYGSAMPDIVGQCAVFMPLLQAHNHVGTVALPSDPAAAAGSACAPTYLQRAVHSCAAPKPCYNFARGDFPQRFRLRPANKHGQPWQQTPLLVVFPGVSTCVRCSRVIKDLS